MSQYNNSPNYGESAFAHEQFHTVNTPPIDRDSYAGINQWSGDQIGPFLFSIISIATLSAMSLKFVAVGVFAWDKPVVEKILTTICIYQGIALFTYLPYRVIGISMGSLFSAATFITVATVFPIPTLAQYTYFVLIACLLITSCLVKEARS